MTSYTIESYKYGSKTLKARSADKAHNKACFLMAKEHRVSYYEMKATIIDVVRNGEIKQKPLKPIYDINDMKRHEFSMLTNDD